MWLLAYQGTSQLPYSWTSVVSPVFVLYLFVCISTPLIEANTDARLGGLAVYNEYKRRTPRLVLGL
jgi:protein-S-isoprenylcysteine O-methyltransferase Ste14